MCIVVIIAIAAAICLGHLSTFSLTSSLRAVQRRMLRDIVRVPRRRDEDWPTYIRRWTRTAETWRKTAEIPDWIEQQRRVLWRWAGHVVRREDARWSSLVAHWWPQGSRRRGRPNVTWECRLEAFVSDRFGAATKWHEAAQDRDSWAEAVDSFAAYAWSV